MMKRFNLEMIGAATDILPSFHAQIEMPDLRMRHWIRSIQYTCSSTLTGWHHISRRSEQFEDII